MATATEVRKAKKNERPFGSPSDDETFETLIPEGAESGKIPKGDQYIGKLIGLSKGVGQESGKPNWRADFTIVEGDYVGMDFSMWLPLTENSLWKMADTLTALGVDWEPGQPINFKRSDVLGTLVRLSIKDDTFQGREVSKLQGILPHPDGAGKKAKSKGAFTVPSKVEEEEEEEQEEERPLKRGRPAARVEEEDEEEDERPVRRGKAPSMDDVWKKGDKRSKAGTEEEEEEEEEEERPRRGRPRNVVEEEEEEEEERPARRKSAKKSRL